jgi:hypothetical protein
VAPAVADLVDRLARGLGFLEPPADKQHERRRTIVVSVYALVLFLPVLFYGFEKGWPRLWILFGIATGLVLAVSAVAESGRRSISGSCGTPRRRVPGFKFQISGADVPGHLKPGT